MSRRPATTALMLLCLFAGARDAAAARDYIFSERGRLLPEWCKSTADGNWDPASPWTRVFGTRNWTHLHHYCRGLYKFDQAMVNWRNERERRFRLAEACDEFDYVLTRTDMTFHMRPEILVKKSHALLLLGRDVEAIGLLGQVLQLRSDYTPAYMMMSNHFLRKGDRETAIELLELGLRHAPDSEALRDRLGEVRAGAGAQEP